ncbi:MAG: S49 family peptidase [Gammaproteobacteria bacterium]|jgi:protease-4
MIDNNQSSSNKSSDFEQDLANQLAREFLKEQRRNRRWGIFFKFLFATYLLGFFAIFISEYAELGGGSISGEKHTALIDINGIIAAGSSASADNIVSGLRAAYKDEDTAGIILRINSPGGSPVQAGYVRDEIYRLRDDNPDIPIYAVISDLCASGGYYIASAADEIYADKASLVGSIGVIMAGFGFVEAIETLGIERRVLHAGENKAFMDPFSPMKDDEIDHVDQMLDEIYEQFKTVVKTGRGDRLLGNDDTVFSGLIWTGERALALGLIDGLGSTGFVAREIIKAEDIKNYSFKPNYLDRIAKTLGTFISDQVISEIKLL